MTASPAVQLTGLRKSFPTPGGVVPAVRDVDIAIAAGETVALLGPNGAGKSTTIDMLLGLTRPDAGSARVFGTDPATAAHGGRIGAMLQSGGLLRELTVRELVSMMSALYPRRAPVDEVLATAGAVDFADRMTHKLSGGQTQRVRFAMALVSDPDLLVLDEPTVAMDVAGRRAFWDAMRGFAGSGKTIVFATHYLDEADSHADRVILMARGRVVADGSPAEIKARVGRRTIRAALPGAAPAELLLLPGVADVERHGDTVALRCSDSDAAIRALLARYPAARDIEIAGADLEEAFLELTRDETEATPEPAR